MKFRLKTKTPFCHHVRRKSDPWAGDTRSLIKRILLSKAWIDESSIREMLKEPLRFLAGSSKRSRSRISAYYNLHNIISMQYYNTYYILIIYQPNSYNNVGNADYWIIKKKKKMGRYGKIFLDGYPMRSCGWVQDIFVN